MPVRMGVSSHNPDTMCVEINGVKYFGLKRAANDIVGLGPDGIMDWEEIKRMAEEEIGN